MAIPERRALSLGAKPTGALISRAAAQEVGSSQSSPPGRPSASWSFLLTTQQEIYMGCFIVFCFFSGSFVNVKTKQTNKPTALKPCISRWASGQRMVNAIIVLNHSFSLVLNFLSFQFTKLFRLNRLITTEISICSLSPKTNIVGKTH